MSDPGLPFRGFMVSVETGSPGKMSGPWVYGSKQVVREDVRPWVYGSKQVVGSWFRQLVERRRGGASALPIRHSRFLCRSGCPMAVTSTAKSSFLMCRGRRTAGPGSAPLPTVAPAGFDQINDDIDALPDPDLLCAEERAAAMAWHTARLRNRIEAYLTGLAGAADTAGDSGSWAQAPPGPWSRSRPDPR